jgi:transcription elongation factor Elf1
MREWKNTRHCPACDDVELSTAVIDDKGNMETWCRNCMRTFIKYDPFGAIDWVDEEWVNTEEQ